MVKNPPANAGDIRDGGLIPGLGRSPGVTTHSSIFDWRILQTEGFKLQSIGLQSWTNLKQLSTHARILKDLILRLCILEFLIRLERDFNFASLTSPQSILNTGEIKLLRKIALV